MTPTKFVPLCEVRGNEPPFGIPHGNSAANVVRGSQVHVEDLLARLDAVRRTSRGWMTRCPAHADRTPSLSIRTTEDERILLHCFAGCSVDAICASVDIALADLFPQSASGPIQRQEFRTDWRKTARRFEDYAWGLRFRAEKVLEAAKGLDTNQWSNLEWDAACRAVGKTHADQERAEMLLDVAAMIRHRGLVKEKARDRHPSAA